jgi:hypothetical protein
MEKRLLELRNVYMKEFSYDEFQSISGEPPTGGEA